MISPFGVEYRDVSKADKRRTAENVAIGATTAGGAWAGQAAVIWPDYHYNEHIHKPWFKANHANALKNPMPEEVDRAKATVAREEGAQAKAHEQNKQKAANARYKAVLAPKEMSEQATAAREKNLQFAEKMEAKPEIKNKPVYDRAKETIGESERKHPHVTNMTREQAKGFTEYTRQPPEHLQSEYHYDPKKPSGDPANVKGLTETNWHKSKGFFRNFPSDLPGSNYRRAGGWYAKGKTGHAVALAAMGTGAYLGYKGSKKIVDSGKVDKKLRVPKKLIAALKPQYVSDKEHWFSPTYLRDPGFMVPATAITAAGGTGYVLAKKRKTKNAGKKEL